LGQWTSGARAGRSGATGSGGAGGAEQRSSGARWKKEGGGEAADERARAVSGGAGERGAAEAPRGLRARVDWAGRRVRLGQRGTGVQAERGRESEGSLGRAGCEWSGGGLCRAGSLGHAREGEELGWVDGWLWAGFQVGLGGFLFSFSFLILIQTQAKRIQINLNSNSNQTTKEEDAPA